MGLCNLTLAIVSPRLVKTEEKETTGRNVLGPKTVKLTTLLESTTNSSFCILETDYFKDKEGPKWPRRRRDSRRRHASLEGCKKACENRSGCDYIEWTTNGESEADRVALCK